MIGRTPPVSSEPFTADPTAADRGLLIAVLVMVLLGVAGILAMA